MPYLQPSCHAIATSAPGGLARHYRVQVWEQSQNLWRMSATFADAAAATEKLRTLEQSGRTARLVRFGHVPTAA